MKITLQDTAFSKSISLILLLLVVFSFVFLEFISPLLYDTDSYYHLVATRLLSEQGPRYQFPYATLSTFRDSFADKEILFHAFLVPFLKVGSLPFVSAKWATIMFTACLLLAYFYIIRKYLSGYLAALFILLPFLSGAVLTYSIWLRPQVLANILMLVGVYSLIRCRHWLLFIIAFIFPFTHISFLLLFAFGFLCEIIRWVLKGNWCVRNIYLVIIGLLSGCLLHPHFPNNFVSLHLNFFYAPFLSQFGSIRGFGAELYSSSTSFIFSTNFAIFVTFGIIFVMQAVQKIRVSFETFAWGGCAAGYGLLAVFSQRNWYPFNYFFFVFFASFVHDLLVEKKEGAGIKPLVSVLSIYLVSILIFFPSSIKSVLNSIEGEVSAGTSMESTGRWLAKNIPAEETIYHTWFEDASYLLYYSPKHFYYNFLDPVYFYYCFPDLYGEMISLSEGKQPFPREVLLKDFKTRYGYVRKLEPLYKQLKSDPGHFRLLYQDDCGAIFAVLDQTEPVER